MVRLLELLFLPSQVLALLLAVAWRRLPGGREQTLLQWAASLLFFLPQLGVFLSWNRSVGLFHAQLAVAALWLLAVAAVTWGPPLRLWRRGGGRRLWREILDQPRHRNPITFMLLGLGAAVGGLVFAYQLVGDLVLPQEEVRGTIEAVAEAPRDPASLFDRVVLGPDVEVRGRRYGVTADLYRRLEPGRWLVARAGRASHQILSVEGLR